MLRSKKCPSSRHSQSRSGVATVEFAVCLPILVMIFVGSLEAANAIFLQQTLTLAAYESAQIATAIGGTETAATTRAHEILTSYDVKSGSVTVTPAITAQTLPRTAVTVTVSAPADANSVGLNWLFKQQQIQKSVTMSRH